MRRGLLVLAAVLLSGCAGTAATPSSTSTPAVSSRSPAGSTASKLVVTVPALPGGATGSASTQPSVSPESSAPTELPTTAAESSVIATSAEGSDPAAPATEQVTSAAPEPVATQPPVATVGVQLANCPDCTVIATAADVAGGLSAALIGQGERGLLLSLDGSGSVKGAINVPYGTVFPSPADGHLACGPDSRCIVAATRPDGRGVASAFQLGADGRWTDLSGSGGFVSATASVAIAVLEGSYAPAIQVSDGTTTVWAVLGWNNTSYQVVGCSPDGQGPQVGSLSLATCLS